MATSVVIVTYNSEDCIRDCIESVQSDDEVNDIVVVDNDSNDETVNILQDYDINIIKRNENTGFGSSVNLAVEYVENDIFCCLNPDSTITPNSVTELVRPLKKQVADISTAAIINEPDSGTISTLGRSIHFSGISNSSHYGEELSSFDNEITECGCISGAAFATSKSVWNEIDGFDSKLFMYKEDVLFSLDSISHGYDICAVPDSVVYHDYDGSSRLWKLSELEKGRYYLIREYYSHLEKVILAPSLFVIDLLQWILFLEHGYEGAKEKIRSYRCIPKSDKNRDINKNNIGYIDPTIDFRSITDKLEKGRIFLPMLYILNILFYINWLLMKAIIIKNIGGRIK